MNETHLGERRRLPPLSALRAFEAAARLGSFKRAAAELGVTPTAISHQVRSLEENVGMPMFERQVRKVVLTDAGAQLFPVLQDGFDAFEAAVSRLTQTRKRAKVTISATSAFTSKWLLPRTARFRSLHPEIDLYLHASDDAVDLERDGVDIAIRYGSGPYPGLLAEPMFTDRYAPVANPVLGMRSAEDIERVPLIHFRWRRSNPSNPTWEAWFERAGRTASDGLGHLRLSDEGHALQAAVAGQGIALLSLALVEHELAEGQLVQPFGPVLDGYTYHIVTSPDRSGDPSVAAVMTWVRSEVDARR